MASNTSVSPAGGGGTQFPGGNWFLTNSRNSFVSTPFWNSLLQTLVWKSANLAVITCRFSRAKSAALLSCWWAEAAIDKNGGNTHCSCHDNNVVNMNTGPRTKALNIANARIGVLYNSVYSWGTHFCSRGKTLWTDHEGVRQTKHSKNYMKLRSVNEVYSW